MGTAAVLHLVPFTNLLTIKKEGVWRNNPLCNWIKVPCGPLKFQWPHEVCRQERPGSRWGPGESPGNVWDAEGSVLPTEPYSQRGVSSEAPGSGLEPLSRGQGELVVPRLCVSMEVDHPGR